MTAVSGFSEMAEELEDFADGLDEAAVGMDEVADNTADETTETAARDASEFAPVDEGDLQQSIFVNPFAKPKTGHIIVAVPYGRHVEYGTFMHPIPPSEETTYDKPVFHPGADPTPYLRPALHLARRNIHTYFEREMEDLFRRSFR